MDAGRVSELVERQRAHFQTHATLDVATRRAALRRLRDAVRAHEGDIAAALEADLGKSADESYLCETGLLLQEIRHLIARVGRWSRPRRVRTDALNAVGSSEVVPVPYGVVLVMAPWNYPFLLALEPLAGALAAGNCCVVKPSAYAPASSALIREICEGCFPPELVSVVEGGRAENDALLDQRWDYVFFTGSPTIGRLVMERAARHLTPVSLELGGKSPCIVDRTADLAVAARRIAFGKWLNAGQTCVAPDYLLVDRTVLDRLVALIAEETRSMYGQRPLEGPALGRIVSRRHFDRVLRLIDPAKVVFGGGSDEGALRVEPTIMTGVLPDDPVMREEIFGPVLPVIAFDSIDEAEAIVTARETPLALYLFTEDAETERRIMREVPFGGGCVNDTILHLASSSLPFGGMGASGMGRYHGRWSFDTFSHEKGVLRKATWPDFPVRYPPFADWKRRLARLVLR